MQLRNILFLVYIMVFFGCKEAKKEIRVETKPVETLKTSKSLYEDLEGNAVALSNYKGKKVLLNYWATWCRPCIEEMPDLLKLQAVLEEENYVFLLASDQSVKKIQNFKTARGFDFKFIKYNGAYSEQKISALPVTIIYNEVGEQVARFDGGMSWNTPEIIKQLKSL